MIQVDKIMSNVRALENAWLKDRDAKKSRKLVKALVKLDWEELLDEETLYGPRCNAIISELEGDAKRARKYYVIAAEKIELMRKDVARNDYWEELKVELLEGCGDDMMTLIRERIEHLKS